MSTRVEPIDVVDASTRTEVQGTLLYNLSTNEVSHIDNFWKPYLDSAKYEMKMRGVDLSAIPDIIGWDWQTKLLQAQTITASSDWNFFGISYRQYIQGAIVISETPMPCRAAENLGKTALGIEFVAAAPWNQKSFMMSIGRQPFLELIGQTLIKVAISASMSAGCEGRLYLYAVPKAETFYADKCGMIDLGLETYHTETLRRYEMTDAQAFALMHR